MALSDREKKDRRNASDRAKRKANGTSQESKDRKNAAQNAKYKNCSVFRADKIARSLDYQKDNSVKHKAYKVVYNANPENKAKQKKRSKAFEQRFLEKNGHPRDTDWNKTRNENLALLLTDFVSRFASNEEIFPDEHEAENTHIRDGAMTRFRQVAGLKLTRERELNRKYAIDQALLSLVDACKKKDPKAVAFRVVDTEFSIPEGGSMVTSMSECAAGAYNYQGVRIDEFSVVKESGVVDEKDLDDLKTFLDENGVMPSYHCSGISDFTMVWMQ